MQEPCEKSFRTQKSARYYELGGTGGALWYVLHGYGELAQSIARRLAFLAAPARRLIVPEGLSRFYREGTAGAVGASWMTKEAREAEIADYVAYLDGLHRAVLAEGPAAAPVTLIGFSQGTATACRWVARGSLRPERIVLFGGALPPDVDLARHAQAFRGLSFAAGERDAWVSAERLEEERARVEAAGLVFRLRRFPGGHRLDDGLLAELAAERP